MEQDTQPTSDRSDTKHEPGSRDRIVFRGVQSVVGIAILAATILTLWNPRAFFKTPDIENLFQSAIQEEQSVAEEFTEQVTRIGILAGHWQDKPGNVCRDGRTEHDVNYGIAYQLQIMLEAEGYRVDLFPEFDEDLFGYQADALVAIYAGSCEENPPPPSGFRVGSSLTVENLDAINDLSLCLVDTYQAQTGLPYAYEVINPEHPSYHIFRDIAQTTPAVRFEIGALSTDSGIIFNDAGAVVQGIADGIICYLDLSGSGG